MLEIFASIVSILTRKYFAGLGILSEKREAMEMRETLIPVSARSCSRLAAGRGRCVSQPFCRGRRCRKPEWRGAEVDRTERELPVGNRRVAR